MDPAHPDRGKPVVVAEGKFLRFVVRDGWEYVERKGSTGIVVIAAVTEDARLLLVEQHRPPVARQVIELPAGLVGDFPGSEEEGMEDAARRELLEETGYRAEALERVAEGPISTGVSDEVITLFLARRAVRVGPGGGDDSEEIVVHAVPLGEVESWLRAQEAGGTLVDVKVFAGLYFARR